MDRTGLESFLIEHRPFMVLRARKITGDPALAEDAVQATYAYLLQNAHRYNPKLPIMGWVLEAVKRRAFNETRYRGRFFPLVDQYSDEYGETPGADVDYEERQQGNLLGEMLGVIAAHDPTHYHLVEEALKGALHRETGAGEGVSRQAIEARLARAFKRWRKLLSKHFTEAEIETALGR